MDEDEGEEVLKQMESVGKKEVRMKKDEEFRVGKFLVTVNSPIQDSVPKPKTDVGFGSAKKLKDLPVEEKPGKGKKIKDPPLGKQKKAEKAPSPPKPRVFKPVSPAEKKPEPKQKTKLDLFLEEMLNEADSIMAVPPNEKVVDEPQKRKNDMNLLTKYENQPKRSKLDSLFEEEAKEDNIKKPLTLALLEDFELGEAKERPFALDMLRINKFTDIKLSLITKTVQCTLPLSYTSRLQYSQLFIESMINEMLMSLKGEIKRLTKGLGGNSPKSNSSSTGPSQLLVNKLLKVNIVVKCHRVTAADVPNLLGGERTDLNDYYLKFVDAVPDSLRKSFMIDDIWVLLDCKKASEAIAKISNPDALDSLILCKSNWHSISGQNMMSVSFLSKPVRFLKSAFAINLINVSTYVQVIENLVSFYKYPQEKHIYARINGLLHISENAEDDFPKNKPLVEGLDEDKVLEKAAKVCEEFALNEDQRAVIYQCAKWFYNFPDESDTHNTVLVHGAFGCGKTFLITGLIIFVSELLEELEDDSTKILVSGLTNIAVDTILVGLLDKGYYNFARIGCLRKINKGLLPFCPYSKKSENERDEIIELRALLAEIEDMIEVTKGTSKWNDNLLKEKEGIEEAIRIYQQNNTQKRIAMLKSKRVVGVTCAATCFEVLRDCTFKIVILDEASQMIEPQSLLSIYKFNCEKLLVVGDPMQLPPILSFENFQDPNWHRQMEVHEQSGLQRTLFSRLHECKDYTILLRTQYRV